MRPNRTPLDQFVRMLFFHSARVSRRVDRSASATSPRRTHRWLINSLRNVYIGMSDPDRQWCPNFHLGIHGIRTCMVKGHEFRSGSLPLQFNVIIRVSLQATKIEGRLHHGPQHAFFPSKNFIMAGRGNLPKIRPIQSRICVRAPKARACPSRKKIERETICTRTVGVLKNPVGIHPVYPLLPIRP